MKAPTATRSEANAVYAAGLVQGIVLVTFPAASTIFTDPTEYDLSSTQYGTMFLPQVVTAIVAALGSDGNSDTAPSTTEGVAFPIHVLALNAMGVHLLDYLQPEDLRLACEASGRWEFLFLAAPLRIVGGTGSPVNPIAIL
jgi:kynurenine formamidase